MRLVEKGYSSARRIHVSTKSGRSAKVFRLSSQGREKWANSSASPWAFTRRKLSITSRPGGGGGGGARPPPPPRRGGPAPGGGGGGGGGGGRARGAGASAPGRS